jgi:hypothetical protein
MASRFHYEWLLNNVTIPAVSNSTTYGDDLQAFGRKAFGGRFHGVYMADQVPSTINRKRPYAIINLDKSAQKGSHWIGAAHVPGTGLLVYDSFGRLHKTPDAIKRLYGKGRVTDPDAEQEVTENNCGARVLAWLMLVDLFGAEEASRI